MKYNFQKYIKQLAALGMLASALLSCSKWDDYKKYTAEGEISYTGKIDSVQVFSGNERVQLSGILKADPKITQMKVFWNYFKDSVTYDIDMASGSRKFSQAFAVNEGIQSFVIYTYDALGNQSVAVNAVGRAYGPRYQNTLNNRLVGSASFMEGKPEITWLPMDLSAGPFATEVRYESEAGTKVVRVPIDAETTVLSDASPNMQLFSFRTLYLPEETSIDTFYTTYVDVGISKDVTDDYLRNTRVPIATSVKGERWGIPTDWVTNAAVRNYKDPSGAFYGGVDYWFGGPFLAMEAGWSADNMTTIVNGKIYQSTTLSPGVYTFEMTIPDCTLDGEFYTVVAEGEGIPNIEDLTSSLAYRKTSIPGTHKVTFIVRAAATISLGFVGYLENKGSGDGTFWRINGIKLQKMPLIDE